MSSLLDVVKAAGKLGEDWATWSPKAEAALFLVGLWNAAASLPYGASDRDKSINALYLLRLMVDEALHLPDLVGCQLADEAWIKLRNKFRQRGAANRLGLFKQLIRVALEPGEGIQRMISRARAMHQELASIGSNLDESFVCLCILANVPDSYSAAVSTLISSARGDALSLQEVEAVLMREEGLMKERGVDAHGHTVLAAQFQRAASIVPPQPPVSPAVDCDFCGMLGHSEPECYYMQQASEATQEQLRQKQAEAEAAAERYAKAHPEQQPHGQPRVAVARELSPMQKAKQDGWYPIFGDDSD